METGFAIFLIIVALLIIVSGPTNFMRFNHAIRMLVQSMRRERHDVEPDTDQQT